MTGEGMRIAAGLTGMGLMVAALVAGLAWFERHWQEFAAAPVDEGELSAEAMVPEYAAARRGCGCYACRRRPTEPCSDYDGD